ncbi:uncharacterized protein LOC105838304 isoform X2 [Monomorium pharaonis]|uniref:uncharacterized protein LOC105838304 isoform X2 n=1 Tax=Monomorium pharaonis TaxID=307658 RepID=UPI00102E1769|nr:uncharacterized protein LOC105838304 isoform X2 [Monomorium pharaonis]
MARISFKVYFMNENPWTCRKVHRFDIDADVAMNFMYLCEKLQTVFLSLRGKSFTVGWKDEENETITISTNKELEIALENMAKKDVYELYVFLKLERDMSKDMHGFSFKYMECPDYDLWTDCMNLDNHLEHYMVRIIQSIKWLIYYGFWFAHHMYKFIKTMAQQHKKNKRRYTRHERKRTGCPMFTTDDESDWVCHEQKWFKKQHKESSAEAATETTENLRQEATRQLSFSHSLIKIKDNISYLLQLLDSLNINVTVTSDNNSAKKPTDNAQMKTSRQKRVLPIPSAPPAPEAENIGWRYRLPTPSNQEMYPPLPKEVKHEF